MDTETPKPAHGYTGWKLPAAEREHLLTLIPPCFPDVIAHHVTERFGVPETTELSPHMSGWIVGTASNDRVQALVVKIAGTTQRHDGSLYHITWSIDRAAGAKPVDSNALVKSGYEALVEPIFIELEPMFFSSETKKPVFESLSAIDQTHADAITDVWKTWLAVCMPGLTLSYEPGEKTSTYCFPIYNPFDDAWLVFKPFSMKHMSVPNVEYCAHNKLDVSRYNPIK